MILDFLSSHLILVTIFILFLIFYVWYGRKYYLLWWKIGGRYPLPFTFPKMMFNHYDIFYSIRQFGPPINKNWYGFSWMGPIPVVYVADPDLMQIILNSPHTINKSWLYKMFSDAFGDGILSLNNSDWVKTRKQLSPVFNHKILINFIPIFNEEANILVNKVLSNYVNKEPVELFETFAKLTFNISNQTTMGVNLKVQTTNKNSQYNGFVELMHILFKRAYYFWLLVEPIFNLTSYSRIHKKNKKIIHEWVEKVIKNKIENALMEEKENLNKNNVDKENVDIKKPKFIFIDRVYDLIKKNELTWDDFESQSKHVMLAAFETTATTLHNVIMMLAMYPDVQNKIFDEINILFYNNDNYQITYEDTQHLPYLEMVISEVQRLFPTIPLIGREAKCDLQIMNKVIIPKGTQLALDLFNLHRNPDHWGKNSNEFNPENFSPEKIAERHPYAHLPFLKGPRNCLGIKYADMAMKIIISKLIHKYKFTTDFKYKDLHCYPASSIRLKVYPKIKILLRKS